MTHAVPVTCAALSECQPSCDVPNCPIVVRPLPSVVQVAVAGSGAVGVDIDIVKRR